MTVLDTSGVVDFLVGDQAAAEVAQLFADEGTLAVPDLLVVEVVAVFRRQVQRQGMDSGRAKSAIEDLGDLPLEIFPALPLRTRVWDLRDTSRPPKLSLLPWPSDSTSRLPRKTVTLPPRHEPRPASRSSNSA